MNRTANRICTRIAAIAIVTGSLSACSLIEDSQFFKPMLDSFAKGSVNNLAELGLAEMAKGDNFRAQTYFERALNANATDVHALYGMALVHQNAGQPDQARRLYERILAIHPVPSEEILIWADKKTHPIVDVAEVNMQLLNSGGMVQTSMGMPVGTAEPQPVTAQMGRGGGMVQSQAQLQPQHQYPTLESVQAQPIRSQSMQPQSMQPQQMANGPLFKDVDLNIVARFKTLRSLLDQGLLTQDEFLIRRKVNVGALLPLTSPPAAVGLDRPVPPLVQISGRLRAIGRALEMRALSPAQHTAERTMIVDALMPQNPASRANPAPPPKGLMQAADAVRRLEMLQKADLITAGEYQKERAAIETSMKPAGSASLAAARTQSVGMMTLTPGKAPAAVPKAVSGFQPAVHLSSYRQKSAALKGWSQLQKRYGSLLGNLETSIERVNLGDGKGVFYRLKAGPLPSNGDAKALCRKLKAKRQYCDPTTINFG
ncbi:MAG: hypothetical protein COB46_11135 [Rhodospirillaceae bacterium]|nr:MAG: hypothetical protein COB46_11135 [Rhodospirillaceae bacterium]